MKFLMVALALSFAAATAHAQAPGVEVQKAWARATPGGARTGAVYMTLTAKGGSDRLVGVASPVAGEAQLHEMSMEGGVMRMRPLPAIELKAGVATVLKPGGMHVMLIGLKHPLARGDSFPLTLRFEKAGEQTVEVHVEKIGAMEMPGMPGMDGGMKGMAPGTMGGH
jgi:periplasmic copper chaperone A